MILSITELKEDGGRNAQRLCDQNFFPAKLVRPGLRRSFEQGTHGKERGCCAFGSKAQEFERRLHSA